MIKMWCCFSLATLRGLLETDVDDVDDAGVSSPDNIRVVLLEAQTHKTSHTMILTRCAACAKPLAYDAPRRVAASVR